jgi:putative ABC transport system substrate-binding protein
MKRRDFITLLGGAAAWPIAARGQQAAVRSVGYLAAGSSETTAAAFRQGLKETGFVEGQNIAIEYRSANGQYDRLPALAAELVSRRVDVIAAAPTPSALAAKAATQTIPIVFAVGTDPVEAGLVASLNKPSGNLTGLSFFTFVLMKKRIELLHELVPQPGLFGALMNPANPANEIVSNNDRKEAQTAALALGRQIQIFEASTASEIDAAFAALLRAGARALVLGNDPFFNSRRDQIAYLAIRHAIPTIVPLREYVTAGGLISYGVNISDIYRQVGVYAGRILKGEKPAELPVMLPSKFELVVNLKTAKAIGLTIPESFLLRADEVIE